MAYAFKRVSGVRVKRPRKNELNPELAKHAEILSIFSAGSSVSAFERAFSQAYRSSLRVAVRPAQFCKGANNFVRSAPVSDRTIGLFIEQIESA